jgi:hypothetical protein
MISNLFTRLGLAWKAKSGATELQATRKGVGVGSSSYSSIKQYCRGVVREPFRTSKPFVGGRSFCKCVIGFWNYLPCRTRSCCLQLGGVRSSSTRHKATREQPRHAHDPGLTPWKGFMMRCSGRSIYIYAGLLVGYDFRFARPRINGVMLVYYSRWLTFTYRHGTTTISVEIRLNRDLLLIYSRNSEFHVNCASMFCNKVHTREYGIDLVRLV